VISALHAPAPLCRRSRPPRSSGDPRADLPVTPEAYRAFKLIPPDGVGALVRKRADGAMLGAMLVERGRVCWAMCNDCPNRLSDLLVSESKALTNEQINALVVECRRDHVPLGETLLSRGLISQPVLHRVLLRHTCESLDHLLREEIAPWTWVDHAHAGYNPLLTFSPIEILVGLQTLISPAAASHARDVLEVVVGPGVRGFAIERTHGSRAPLAQIGCDVIDLPTLGELSGHADEIMAVATTSDLILTVVELGQLAFASWAEDNIRYVLLRDGELAFNQLLAHVVATTIAV
jgi:hypothetical protein